MPQIDKYADYCKTLFIQFKCTRCGFEVLEPLKDCISKTGDNGGYLRQFSVPKGWYDKDYEAIALCPTCFEAYRKFMRGEE